MAKFRVTFDVRKDNIVASPSITVEASSESMAVRLAATQLKANYAAYRTYSWSPKKIVRA